MQNHISQSTKKLNTKLTHVCQALPNADVAMSFTDARGKGKPLKRNFTLIGKDVGYALIGLAVSIALAIAINPEIDNEIFRHFFG